MTTTTPTDTLRNADLAQLAAALNDQRTRAVDLVIPARDIRFNGAALDLTGLDPVITDDGVTDPNGRYTPTMVGDEGIATKLDIPLRYLRRMRENDPGLYDANVNTWLSRSADSYLLRLLRGDDATETRGVLRAWLSDRYRTIDNFDVLLATLQGIRDSGMPIGEGDIQADLTDRRMYTRVSCPAVSAMAPELLHGYRSPFTGETGTDNPTVFAGFVITNSETGNGAFSIVPRLVVQVCSNGMTITKDATREIHLGSRLDTGVVRWSPETLRRNLALVTSQTADAVATFLDRDYLVVKLAELEQAAGVPVKDAPAVITAVSKKLGFTEDQQTSILNHFIAGGQLTAGGVMQAITATAQTVDDGDTAHALEAAALPALELAAAASAR